jgi:peptidoglycan/xylan/chitin deacetylase (PgdA/CDA1 family)
MRWVARRFQVVSLKEVLRNISPDGRFSSSRPQVLITFDDGYRDNLTHAAPVLRELGMPATLFATSGFIDGVIPWWDRVAWILNQSRRGTIALDRPERVTLSLDDRPKALTTLIEAYIRAGWAASDADLNHLAERAEVDESAMRPEARQLFLDWDQLRTLHDAGWSIGAHTVTHRRLTSLDEKEQRHELIASKTRLEHILGCAISTLAYPFGGTDAFDEVTRRVARDAGYRAAFALRPALVRPGPIDAWAIPRLNVGRGDTLNMLRARWAMKSLTRSPPS